MTPLISIIIPVFNVEDYLLVCLNSIAAQTWRNLEVILVDDGSTDLSGKLCDEYCLNDSRFQVIHQPNAGQGPARNTGMNHSSGMYVMFVDSDDSLSPSAVETSYHLLSSGPYDWSMIGFVRTNEAGDIIEPIQENATATVVTGPDALAQLLFGNERDRYTFCFVWGKLFRRTVIEGILSEAFYSGQDTHFCFRVFQKTQQAIFLDNSLYNWRQRSSSITHKNVEKALFHSFQAFAALEKETPPENSGALRSLYLKKLYRRMVTTRIHLMKTNYSSQFLEEARMIRAKTIREYFGNSTISSVEKVGLSLAWALPHFSRILFRLKGN